MTRWHGKRTGGLGHKKTADDVDDADDTNGVCGADGARLRQGFPGSHKGEGEGESADVVDAIDRRPTSMTRGVRM